MESGVHIGNYVEVKESHLGHGVLAGHFSYLGDASIGAGTNIGAGTITCNFDGKTNTEPRSAKEPSSGVIPYWLPPCPLEAAPLPGGGMVNRECSRRFAGSGCSC